MTLPTYLPSLSESGWITSSLQKADFIFSHFFESNFSQTEIYKGHVSSFAYLLATYHNDNDRLVNEMQSVLTNYFGRYFNSVDCEVKWTTNAINSSIVELTLYLTFVDAEGKEYNLSKIISTSGNKIISVLNSNNYGT